MGSTVRPADRPARANVGGALTVDAATAVEARAFEDGLWAGALDDDPDLDVDARAAGDPDDDDAPDKVPGKQEYEDELQSDLAPESEPRFVSTNQIDRKKY